METPKAKKIIIEKAQRRFVLCAAKLIAAPKVGPMHGDQTIPNSKPEMN